MIKRDLEPEILAALAQFPCVALLGARQVGKTTLARRVAAARRGAVRERYPLAERVQALPVLECSRVFETAGSQ